MHHPHWLTCRMDHPSKSVLSFLNGTLILRMHSSKVQKIMKPGKKDAVICLGCIIQGETKHDEYIAAAVASGIMQLGLMSGIPVIFGVLTTNTEEQAKERAGGKHGNKGSEAAVAALQMAILRTGDTTTKKRIGY